MSKGGGGGGSTTTIQKADPWSGLQGPLNSLYSEATKWYGSNYPQYYPGQTLAPTNANIENALGTGANTALQNYGNVTQAGNQLAQTAAGRSPFENPGFGILQNFAQGGVVGANPAQHTFGQFSAGDFMGQNTANPYLLNEAEGKYLTDQTNPYLRGLYENATAPLVSQFQNAIAPGLASQFSAAGRTGSGASAAAFGNAADSLGRSLSQTATGLYGGAYENERQRQQQAINALSGNYNTERGMQLQGASGLGSMNAAERAQQLQAAQSSSNAYNLERGLQQQAQLAAPTMAAARYSDLDKLLGIGQFQQGQAQAGINEDRARYDYNQNVPLMKLQALNQILQGGSVYAGGSSTQNQSLNRNPFASALGGAAAANAIGGTLGGDLGGIIGGPWGLLGGALLGGLFG